MPHGKLHPFSGDSHRSTSGAAHLSRSVRSNCCYRRRKKILHGLIDIQNAHPCALSFTASGENREVLAWADTQGGQPSSHTYRGEEHRMLLPGDPRTVSPIHTYDLMPCVPSCRIAPPAMTSGSVPGSTTCASLRALRRAYVWGRLSVRTISLVRWLGRARAEGQDSAGPVGRWPRIGKG